MDLSGTKCTVTGGAGFIGSHIVDALLSQGAKVQVVDDFSTGDECNLKKARESFAQDLRVDKADISSNYGFEVMADFKPDIIFHQAAQANVRASVEDPVFDANVNVIGTINVLKAAQKSGTQKLLFASTGGAIYGEQDQFPAPETHATRGECPYGVSKRAGELYIDYYSRVCGFSAVALRYGNVYGPRQNPKGEAGVVAIFCKGIISKEGIRVNGDGLQTRDYIFIEDVVKANLLAAAKDLDTNFEVFNVGTSKESSVLDIVEALNEVSGLEGQYDLAHGPAMPGEQRRSVIDNTKLSSSLGWRPSADLKDGIRQTYQSFLDLV